MLKPVLHWVGGKRQLLAEIKKRMPKKFDWYYEPFLGGGALLFDLQPEKAVVNDANLELINLYRVIKRHPEELLNELNSKPLRYSNTKERFLVIRKQDRDPYYLIFFSDIQKAARTLYLNKTCFNGLYRLNKQGQFNTPFGYHKNDPDWEPELIRAMSRYLNKPGILLLKEDFAKTAGAAAYNDFVYFDPPYDPLTETANFTAYTAGDFNRSDHKLRLYETFVNLTEKGVKCMLSNANTPFIKHLYRDFKVEEIEARRSVNSNGGKRGLTLCDVIITNY